MSKSKTLTLITSTRGSVGKSIITKNLAAMAVDPVVIHVESVNKDSLPKGIPGAIVFDHPEMSELITLINENDDHDVIVDFGASMQRTAEDYADDLSALALMADVVIVPTTATDSGITDAVEAIKLLTETFQIFPERILVCINRVKTIGKAGNVMPIAVRQIVETIRAECEAYNVSVAETLVFDRAIISQTHGVDERVFDLAREEFRSLRELETEDRAQMREGLARRKRLMDAANADQNIRELAAEIGAKINAVGTNDGRGFCSPFNV